MTDPRATETGAATDSRLEGYQQVALVLLGLFGCLVTWGGMSRVAENLWLRQFGLETTGVVIEHEAESTTIAGTSSRGSRSTTVFRPIVAIATPDGTARIRGTLSGGLDRIAPIGARVRVLYPAGRPADGRISSEMTLSWIYLLTAILGLGMAAAPLAILLLTGTWRLSGRPLSDTRS
jgi:hypothetical protein